MGSASAILDVNNKPWTGFRYSLLSSNYESLTLAEVSSIIPPTITIDYRTVPTLSQVQRKIPSKIMFGDITLQGGVFRHNAFYECIRQMLDAMLGLAPYSDQIQDLILTQFDVGPLMTTLPMQSWIIKNAQPKQYTPAQADANISGDIPFHELVLTCDEFKLIG